MSSAAAAVEDSIQELREVNRLVYLKPDNGALVDKRTMKSYNFSSASFAAGRSAQCLINSGGDAIWGPTSYLRMEYTKADGASTVGSGSVLNFIRSVRLTHRSGEVLEFIDNYNVLGKLLLAYAQDGDDAAKMADMLQVPLAAGTYVVTIPMWILLGVFAEQSQYIPPGFLAGARLDVLLENDSIIWAAPALGDALTDVNLSLVLDSSQVYDSVTKQIMDEQADVARSGLQFSYSTWFNTHSPFGTASVNFDVQQSASITQMVTAVIRPQANLVLNADSFAFSQTALKTQWRLGSQYFPQQALELNRGQQEAYYTTLVAWDGAPMQFAGKRASGKGADVGLAQWSTAVVAPPVPFNGLVLNANYAQTMEKSSTGLQLTGEATNNARILNLEMTKTAVADRVDVFLKYLRVANIMGDNVVVDR